MPRRIRPGFFLQQFSFEFWNLEEKGPASVSNEKLNKIYAQYTLPLLLFTGLHDAPATGWQLLTS